MPLYEYRCPTCRTTFERLRPMSRVAEAATCPKGHRDAERVVSLVASRVRGFEDGAFAPTAGGCACGGACSCR